MFRLQSTVIWKAAQASLITLMTLGSIAHGVAFKHPLVLPTATAGTNYSLDLRTLLADAGFKPYKWSSSDLPAGLTIDQPGSPLTNNLLSGVIATPGNYSLHLTVTDSDPNGEGSDLNHPATLLVLPPPPQFKVTDIALPVTKEGDTLTANLRDYLVNPASANSFTATGLPPWLSLTSDGKLSGVPTYSPQHLYVGDYSGIVFTATNTAGNSTATGHGTVIKKIIPPKWISNPIALTDAYEEKSYSADTSQFVLNPEGSALKYEIISMTPPPWLQIGKASGTLFGTPTKPGAVEVVVSLTAVIDGATYTDSTTFKLNIIHVNHAPKWLANPIVLPNTNNGMAVTQPLAKSATDSDGDTLSFSMTGPDWATLDAKSGTFKGTPGKSNLGLNSFQATVTDPSGASDTTVIQITVIKANEPPSWNSHPTQLPDAAEDKNYGDMDLTKYVTDPDNDKVYFAKLGGPEWLTVNANGTTTGTPGMKDVGLNRFQIKVSDHLSTPDDVAEVQIMVAHTNHAPYWTVNPIILSFPEEKPISGGVAQYAKDVDLGDSLLFSMVSGPNWAQMDKNGNLSGTPAMSNEGENHYTVVVADSFGATAQVELIIKVLHVNHPPAWTTNPIVLPNATEDAPYSANLSPFATDPDLPNDRLHFYKISQLPTWLSINEDGSLIGKPSHTDAGKLHTFQVRVLDDANVQAVTTVQISVDKINHAPFWTADPIPLNDAYEDTAYNFPVNAYATDPDGDKLSFEKVDGPGWIAISATGIVTGTPGAADVGESFTATFKITDPGGLTATTRGKIKVIHKNHPPVVSTLPLFTVKERETAEFNLTEYVKDPDVGDVVHFTLLATAGCGSWVVLSDDGKLTLDRPSRRDLGAHDCNFKVDDGKLMSTGVLHLQVDKNPRAPIWLSEPIASLEAKTNEPFSSSVAAFAKDLDGEKLTFSRPAGKDWLKVNPDGSISGTPTDAELGNNEFTLRVTNEDSLFADGTLIIKVVPGTQKDKFQVDKMGPAASELTWVIDNSKWCNNTIKALKKYINVFYDDLKNAQISHENILISSDVEKFGGLPIAPAGEGKLFGSSSDDLPGLFGRRLDAAASISLCSNCRNSPIWGIFRLNEQLPTPKLSDIYHNGYVMPGIPNDTMLITHQLDHYKHYTSKLPEPLKSYTPNDFARDFVNFEKQEKKGYRVSAIAPGCGPGLISNEPSSAGPANAYNVIVQKTNGTYYVNQCQFDMEAALHDYARDVIFRARVHGNNPFKLSKPPKDVKSIRVSIAGTPIGDDKWVYDSGANTVAVNWYLIDTSKLKAGDQIEVEYRVSR